MLRSIGGNCRVMPATVQGDVHDIGKNLAGMMLEGGRRAQLRNNVRRDSSSKRL